MEGTPSLLPSPVVKEQIKHIVCCKHMNKNAKGKNTVKLLVCLHHIDSNLCLVTLQRNGLL